jgi:hypothetical protein
LQALLVEAARVLVMDGQPDGAHGTAAGVWVENGRRGCAGWVAAWRPAGDVAAEWDGPPGTEWRRTSSLPEGRSRGMIQRQSKLTRSRATGRSRACTG